jgi:hypothetical protein
MCRTCSVEKLYNLSLRGPKGRGNLLRYKQKKSSLRLRLLRGVYPFEFLRAGSEHSRRAPKKIGGFCSGRIEIAAVAELLRNDIRGLFSFLCILRIRSGARNDILRTNVFYRACRTPLILNNIRKSGLRRRLPCASQSPPNTAEANAHKQKSTRSGNGISCLKVQSVISLKYIIVKH